MKIIFPIVVTTVVALFVPSAVPLIGMLMFGNLVKEIGANTFRLFDAASNSIMNAATIFLGLSVGATMTSEAFLNWTTIGIVVGGFLAFALSIAGGIFFVKLVNLFTKKKINPLIGATGLSAVPMASRVAKQNSNRSARIKTEKRSAPLPLRQTRSLPRYCWPCNIEIHDF